MVLTANEGLWRTKSAFKRQISSNDTSSIKNGSLMSARGEIPLANIDINKIKYENNIKNNS